MQLSYTSQDPKVMGVLTAHPIAETTYRRNYAWAVLRWHDFKTGRIEGGGTFARYIEKEIFPTSNFGRYHTYT